jgi:hypothetical protein
VLVTVGVGLAASLVLPVLFSASDPGVGFATPTQFTLLFAAAMVLNLGLLAHKGLEIAERSKQVAATMAVALAINVGVCLLTVGRLGMTGATLGLLSGGCFYVVVAALGSMKALRIGLGAPR